MRLLVSAPSSVPKWKSRSGSPYTVKKRSWTSILVLVSVSACRHLRLGRKQEKGVSVSSTAFGAYLNAAVSQHFNPGFRARCSVLHLEGRQGSGADSGHPPPWATSGTDCLPRTTSAVLGTETLDPLLPLDTQTPGLNI